MNLILTLVIMAMLDRSSSTSLVTMPSVNNMLPCTDVAENCARSLYGIQKTDATSLSDLQKTADTTNGLSGDFLDTVRSLKSTGETLTDLVDPKNQTAGGQVLLLSTGRKLNGVYPYMGTISNKIVNRASQSYADLNAMVTQLSNGMGSITRMFTDSVSQVSDRLKSVSDKAQADITDSSVALRELMVQADGRLTTGARQFSTSQSAGPTDAAQVLAQSLSLEQNDYDSARTQLGEFYSQIAALPQDLQTYQNERVQEVASTRSTLETAAASAGATSVTAFGSDVSATAADAWLRVQGVSTSDTTHKYYEQSMKVLSNAKTAQLNAVMDAANNTEQANIATLKDDIMATTNSIPFQYLPMLNELNAYIAARSSGDAKFLTDTKNAYLDGNSTLIKSKTSWDAFTNQMNRIFATTGGILTGQTTTITSALLNQIGSMTQEAGAGVNNMSDLMLQAGTGEMEADAVRRAILANSNKQVITAIGSNEAAMNASFATIANFMNKSKEELAYILNVVKFLSGDEIRQLNASAFASMNNVSVRINGTRNGALNLMTTLRLGSANEISNDRIVLTQTYTALNATGAKALTDANAAVTALAATNAAELYITMGGKVNRSVAALNSLVANTNALVNNVANISQYAVLQNANLSNFRDLIVNTSSQTMNSIMSNFSSRTTAGANLAKAAAASLGVRESSSLNNLTTTYDSLTSNYSLAVSRVQGDFDALLVQLGTNQTIMGTAISDAGYDLAGRITGIEASARSTESSLESIGQAALDVASNDIQANIDSAQRNVTTYLQGQIDNQTGRATGAITNYTRLVPEMANNISALTTSVDTLQEAPAEMLVRAKSLMDEFRGDLDALRDSVAVFASDSASTSRADTFATKLTAALKGGTTDLDSSITEASVTGSAKQADAIDRMKQLLATSITTATSQTTGIVTNAAALQSAANEMLARTVNVADSQMNSSADSWAQAIASLNSTIVDKMNATATLQARLATLGTQLSGAQATAVASTASAVAAGSKLVNALISSTTAAIAALMDTSGKALTRAQRDQVTRQLATANIGLNANEGSQALADAVAAAIASVSTMTGTATANNNYVKDRIAALSAASNHTVQLSSADISAVISKYLNDTSATQAALRQQLAAANKAAASVGDAKSIWTKLKDQETTIGRDELENLVDIKNDVFDTSDVLISSTRDATVQQISTISSTQEGIRNRVISVHNNNADPLVSTESHITELSDTVDTERLALESSVKNLRGFANGMAIALKNRLANIVAQAATFRSAIHEAAVTDISHISE